ncbi:MAG: nucleotidyltransferase domain-containing protein [Candidatus Woesearchaeota archaeon]
METIELSIISELLKEPRKRFTIEELAKRIGSNKAKHSRASIFRYCNKLLKQQVLNSEDIGRVKQVALNFRNDETIALLAQIETIKKSRHLRQISPALQEYFKRLEISFKQIHEIHSILVFGSYAKSKQRKDSDLDLMFLIEQPHAIHAAEYNKMALKRTKDLINTITNDLDAFLPGVKLSPVIIELEDYRAGIKENKIDLVTESFKDHIIIKNPFGYWEAAAGELV